MKRIRLTPWWFCCGRGSYWCVLDVVSGCRWSWVCHRHDAALVRYYDRQERRSPLA